MRSLIITLAVVATLWLAAARPGAASPFTYVYDFAGNDDNGVDLAQGTIFSPLAPPFTPAPTVAASAFTVDGGGSTASQLVRSSFGLGVRSDGEAAPESRQVNVAGDVAEWLSLTINVPGALTDAALTRLLVTDLGSPTGTDDLLLYRNGVLVATLDFGATSGVADLAPLSILVQHGDVLSLAASQSDRQFALRLLELEAVRAPEPASLALWSLLGLGAAGYYRRRQRAMACFTVES